MRMLDEGLLDDTLQSSFGADRREEAHPVRPSAPAALACAIAVWLCAIAFFYATYQPEKPLPEGLKAGRWTFELLEDAKKSEFGFSAPARVFIGEESFDVRVLYGGETRYMARERFEAYATFEKFSDRNAMRFAQAGLLADASVKGDVEKAASGWLAPLIELRSWASDCLAFDESRGSALLRALVTGDRIDLERDGLYDDMKAVGLAHMVAVSGSHLSVIAAMAGALLRRLGVRIHFSAVILCLFYAAYAVFTGLSAPVIRAAVMSSVVVSAVWARRRSSALAALSVCVCVLIGIDPHNALSLSFFLSAASTFGVVLFAPLFTSWITRAASGRAPGACEAFALTLAASLPIAPVTAAVFSRLSFVAPLANFLAAPVFSVFLAAGLIALALCAVAPAIGHAAIGVLSFFAEIFCRASEALACVPFASVPVTGDASVLGLFTVAAIAVLWVWWPKLGAYPLRIAFACVLAACFAATLVLPRVSKDEIAMLDVGQGDAVLIRSEGASLLVDTGNQEQKLMAALARRGITSIDAVVVTHHDDDHCGCLELLAPNVTGGVLLAQRTFSCECEGCRELVGSAVETVGVGRVSGLSVGDVVSVGRFSCTVVWPYEFEEEGGNADSLCLLVEYDAEGDGAAEKTVLLTGDAEAAEIRSMLDKAGLAHVDIMKAGHHGSKAGVEDGLGKRIGADAVLISAGEGNRYGHPSSEALEEFEGAGARIFRTDTQGDIVCRFEGGEADIFTQR